MSPLRKAQLVAAGKSLVLLGILAAGYVHAKANEWWYVLIDFALLVAASWFWEFRQRERDEDEDEWGT